MAEEQGIEYELHEVGYIDLKKPIEFPVINDTPVLLKYAEIWRPNVVLRFECEDMRISVDLSPIIRYSNVKDCFDTTDCMDSKLSEAVLKQGSILLVNKPFTPI